MKKILIKILYIIRRILTSPLSPYEMFQKEEKKNVMKLLNLILKKVFF